MGFGWNFYGFFLFAIAWIVLYFAWARYAARRDRRPEAGRANQRAERKRAGVDNLKGDC
jgi:membrane protein implicated in regulation of membrane protease activity